MWFDHSNFIYVMARCIKNVSFIFCFQFFIAAASAQQQQHDSLTLIVSEIESSNVYEMSYTVGYAGKVSKQYLRFKQLLQLASVGYLSELAVKHSNTIVRLYAFQALKQKLATIPEDVTKYFTNDNTVVRTLSGCLGGSQTVNVLATQKLIFNGF